jgi:hypothetical protein
MNLSKIRNLITNRKRLGGTGILLDIDTVEEMVAALEQIKVLAYGAKMDLLDHNLESVNAKIARIEELTTG